MKKVSFIISFLFVTVIVAQSNTSDLFEKANNKYKEGNYQEAANLYQQIEAKDSISSSLYFNLANTYYKLNSVANSIYYFEKALLIDPLNKDAVNNLEFAKRMTIDNIEVLPKTFLQKLENNYIKKLSYNQWAISTIMFVFLSSFLFLLFYFSNNSSKKRFYFLTSILAVALFVISIFTTYNQYQKAINTKYAIIFVPKISVNNAPTVNSDEVFVLNEGTKVNVLDAIDNWKKIKLADGKVGWISADALKVL